MVNEEVGARKRGRGSSAAGIITLILVAAYLGWLANLHARAIDVLLANEYHGRVALSAGAFPESSAPFDWYGVVVTDDTIETVEVPLGPGREFDPHMSATHYKPGESPALDAAERTDAATRFLAYARFPFAIVRPLEGDYRVEIRDLRFPSDDTEPANIFVRVERQRRNADPPPRLPLRLVSVSVISRACRFGATLSVVHGSTRRCGNNLSHDWRTGRRPRERHTHLRPARYCRPDGSQTSPASKIPRFVMGTTTHKPREIRRASAGCRGRASA